MKRYIVRKKSDGRWIAEAWDKELITDDYAGFSPSYRTRKEAVAWVGSVRGVVCRARFTLILPTASRGEGDG